jgi:hypothetical protein
MIKIRAKATYNNKPLFEGEGKHFSAVFEAEKALRNKLAGLVWKKPTNGGRWTKVPPPVEGAKGEIVVRIQWECTMNHRAAPRPKHVIQAEYAQRAAEWAKKDKERREHQAKWEKEQAEETARLRQRISHQVDHAFALGKQGTEPAAKYITCGHCNRPAALLGLNTPLAPGVAVLDEDTIETALCDEHGKKQNQQYYIGKSKVVIPCDRLEFFYDGIRQIAIKAGKAGKP